MRILIVGCGYVGVPLGAELVKLGHEVHGLRRTLDGAAELEAAGIKPLAGDVSRPEYLAALPGPYDWVVNLVSSSKGGPEAYQQVYVDGSLRGQTPYLAVLPVGHHAVRVGSPRLEKWRAADVTVRENVVHSLEVDLTE